MQQCYARVGLQMRCGIASSYAQTCERPEASTHRAASIRWRGGAEVIEPADLEERRGPASMPRTCDASNPSEATRWFSGRGPPLMPGRLTTETQNRRLSQADDETSGELDLPRHVEAKRQHAPALHTGDPERVGIDERGEHPAVEAHADTRSRKHFHAAASSEGETDRVVGFDGIPRQAEHAGQERPHTAAALELLQRSGLPVIHRGAEARRRR